MSPLNFSKALDTVAIGPSRLNANQQPDFRVLVQTLVDAFRNTLRTNCLPVVLHGISLTIDG